MRKIKFASVLLIPLIAACTTPPSSHVPETPDHIQQPTPSAIDNCAVGCPLGGSSTTLYRQAYTLNNNGTPRAASFCDFQVTVAEIEERSGLKMWIGLPLEVQTKLKLAKGRLPQKIGCSESAAVAAN